MKKKRIMKLKKVPLLLFGGITAAFFAGCATSQSAYTSRVVDIQKENIKVENASVDISVDFNKTVTATETRTASFGTVSTKQMLTAAYFKCIRDNKIDFVVDPLTKITVAPSLKENNKPKLFEKIYTVEIFGFAGYFNTVKTQTDAVKQLDSVSMDNVVKYKLLTDPFFSKEYYMYKTAILQNEKNNKNIYFMLGNGQTVVPQKTQSLETDKTLSQFSNKKSLALKPQSGYSVDEDLLTKGIKQRNTGLILLGAGLAMGNAAGLPLYWCAGDHDWDMELSGITLMAAGNALALTGIITAACGGSKISKAKRGGNLTFNYRVSPSNVGLAINF